MTRRSILSVILALIICIGIFPAASAEKAALTDEQANAIAMLNYITVLTQGINASKNSRLYMEEAYSSLVNNTYPQRRGQQNAEPADRPAGHHGGLPDGRGQAGAAAVHL